MSHGWRQAHLPPGVTHRVMLVRHGETDASMKGRCYGKLDVPLSTEGVSQVKKTAQLIAPLQPTFIVSSPRIRALDSAEIIAHRCQLSVSVNEQFAELDFGDLEGERYEDVEAEHPKFFAQWMSNPTQVTFPNGESYQSMAERVVMGYDALLQNNRDAKCVLVAHGGVIRIILAHVLELDAGNVFRLDQSYAGISCIDYYESTPVLRVMNWLG